MHVQGGGGDKTTAAPPRHINAIEELRGGCVCSTSPNTHTHLPRWKILLLANTSGLKGDRRGGAELLSLGTHPTASLALHSPPRARMGCVFFGEA